VSVVLRSLDSSDRSDSFSATARPPQSLAADREIALGRLGGRARARAAPCGRRRL